MSAKLLPGTSFPSVEVKTLDGSIVNLQANGSYKLIVIYRGQFCPFCKISLTDLNNRVGDLRAVGVNDIIAVSADKLDVAKIFAEENSLNALKIGVELSVAQMRTLGLYVSTPTHYIPQEHNFSEPAFFVLKPDNSIKYVDIASAPFAGRVNVDFLLGALTYVFGREKEEPDFKKVFWGSA